MMFTSGNSEEKCVSILEDVRKNNIAYPDSTFYDITITMCNRVGYDNTMLYVVHCVYLYKICNQLDYENKEWFENKYVKTM